MIVTTVMIHVKEEYIQDFIEASIRNHEKSIQEPGNLRFDLLQQVDNPSRFMLYEAYDNEEEAGAHKKTDHYKEWRETVAGYMAEPRQGIRYRAIRPK